MREFDLTKSLEVEIIQKIQNGFSTKERELYILAKTSIFSTEKRLILSSDTIQSHTHHNDIKAQDYAQITKIAKNTKGVFAQSNIIYVLLGLGNGQNYRLTLKNILNSDEIFATSLVKLSKINGIEKEYKKLSKKYKIVE